MRKLSRIYLPLVIFIATLNVGLGQKWIKSSTNNETKVSKKNFHEVQKAFYEYWAPFKVENGRYINSKGDLVKAAGWKQFKRWEWFMESHTDFRTGALPTNVVDFEFEDENTGGGTTYDNWTSLGPNSSDGGFAGVGRINSVAFHPTDVNTFWVGTPAGGLWRTTDNGATWTALTDNLSVIGVSNVVIPSDYATSKTIYISTGDRDGFDTRSSGVLKSTDDGATWTTAGLTFAVADREMVTQLLLNPNDDKHILAATTDGLYETKDATASWTKLPDTEETIDYIEPQPGTFTTLFAVSDSHFYKSTDGGATWTKKLTMTSTNSKLTVSANDPNRIYVLNADEGLDKVYKSTDAGETFTTALDGNTLNLLGWEYDGQDVGGQGWYDLTIEASPTDANTLLVGGVNTWKSTDAGATWSVSNHWFGDQGSPAIHADKHELIFRSNGDLFEANDGGLYKSSDAGTTYLNNSNGIVNSQMYKISVAETDVVISGLQDNGSKMFNGTTWSDVLGGDGMNCVIDFTDAKIQYASSQYGSISRTTDSWANSISISSNIGDGTIKGRWITPFMLDPNDHKTIFVGYVDIWKSTDMGDTFTKLTSFGGVNMREMAIAQSNSNYLYAYNDSFQSTNDGGATWTDLTAKLPSTDLITDIEVDFQDPLKLWLTFGDYDTDRVFYSADGGNTWTNISAGLPSIPTHAIVQRDIASVNQLYIGTDVGVYVKNDDQDWVLYSENLPNVIVTDLEIRYNKVTPNDGKLIAATYGRGAWITPLFPDLKTPTDINLSASSIAENNAVDATFGTFTTVDPDVNDSHTYSFVDGTNDNASFAIAGDALKVSSALNFETKSSYKIMVKSCDIGNLCFEKEFTLTVTDANDTPSALALDNASIAENNAVDAQIGLMTTTDEDPSDTHTYTLVDGFGDNATFKISANALQAGEAFDFETKSSYSIKLKTCDGGSACFEKEYTIQVTDANDGPTDIGLDNLVIMENNAADATIGALTLTDEDAGDTHTFTLPGGSNDNAGFNIDGTTLKANMSFDFETKTTHDIMIRVEDAGGLAYEEAFTITIENEIESSIDVPAQLNFENTALDWSREMTVTVENDGETDLTIAIANSNAVYTISPSSMTLNIGQSEDLTITFGPPLAQRYESTVTFTFAELERVMEVVGTGAIITGVDDGIVDADEVKIYPNPASDQVIVDLKVFGTNKPELKFVSPTGAELLDLKNITTDEVVIDTSIYPSGIYLIRLAVAEGVLSRKVMIKKQQ